jgi:F0F1-type ATP synthase membrane subunit c/vacuolar-type H+-ATPase subunit K
MIQTLKIISTGTITGLKIGAGVGMGVVFGSGILSVYRNLGHPKERPQFFNYALLGFTYTEAYAAGLFALICLLALVCLLFLDSEQEVSLLILPASIKSDKGTKPINISPRGPICL